MNDTMESSSTSIEEEASHLLLQLLKGDGIGSANNDKEMEEYDYENGINNNAEIFEDLLTLHTQETNSWNDGLYENTEGTTINCVAMDENKYYRWTNDYDPNGTLSYTTNPYYYSESTLSSSNTINEGNTLLHSSGDYGRIPYATSSLSSSSVILPNEKHGKDTTVNDPFPIPSWTFPSSLLSESSLLLSNTTTTVSERLNHLHKYYQKRRNYRYRQLVSGTDSSKPSQVRYDCRKSLADSRIRINGRFVKAEVANTIAQSLLRTENTVVTVAENTTCNTDKSHASPVVVPPSLLPNEKRESSLSTNKTVIPGLYIPQKMIHLSKTTVLINDSNTSSPSNASFILSSSVSSANPKRKRVESVETVPDTPNNVSSNQSTVDIDGYESSVSVNPLSLEDPQALFSGSTPNLVLNKPSSIQGISIPINSNKKLTADPAVKSRSRLLSIDSISSVDAGIQSSITRNHRQPKAILKREDDPPKKISRSGEFNKRTPNRKLSNASNT